MTLSRRGLLKVLVPVIGLGGIYSSPTFSKSKESKASKPHAYMRTAYAANLLVDGKHISIECYGDSTMWGSTPGHTEKMNDVNPSSSLEQSLNLLYPGQVRVINKAIPGTTIKKLLTGTDGGIGTYEDRISTSDSLVIFCNHCLNDCNSYQSNEEEYRNNLVNFIKITRRHNKIPVLVTPSIISPVIDGKDFMMKRMPAFIKTMKDVASAMNVDIVDNYYYSFKTSRMIPASKINGDGIHLNTESYQNAGWNMSIPLVLPNVLVSPYDLCGISTSFYRDNITQSRGLWKDESRFGSVLTGDAIESKQFVYFPFILDNPTDHTLLVIGGFKGEVGGIGEISYFGEKNDSRYSGIVNYKKDGGEFHDETFQPKSCKLAAGFHIIGVEASISEGGKNFNFAGVQLQPVKAKQYL